MVDHSFQSEMRDFRPPSLAWPVWALAAGQLALHWAAAGRYGWFRDELYYVACSRHLAWGYVDHPPLVAFLVWIIRHTLGDSLIALRLPAALAMALVVVLCGVLARMLGGGRFAQALAALAACLSPAFLAMGSILTMNPFDILWWTLAVTVLSALLQRDRPRLWIYLGTIFGVAALTKLNVAFLAAALLIGVLFTRNRRWLAQPWPWISVAIALAIASPYLRWEQASGWPTLEFMRNIHDSKNYPVSPFEFTAMQFAVVHPMLFPIWVAGLAWLFFSAKGRNYRLFAWAYLALFVTYCLLQAKFYYLFPIYPILFAAGGVAIERWSAAGHRLRWRPVSVAILLVTTIPMVPLTVPVLPFSTFLNYNALLDIQRHLRFERGRDRQLPIVYSDMLAWPQLAATVAEVHAELPADERDRVIIFADDYGAAGALEYFGRIPGSPPVYSAHNAYHSWGPGPEPWRTVIAVGFRESDLRRLFAEVTPVAVSCVEHAREPAIPVAVCREPVVDIAAHWPNLRRYR